MNLLIPLKYSILIASFIIGWVIPYLSTNRSDYLKSLKNIKIFKPSSKKDFIVRVAVALTSLIINIMFHNQFDAININLIGSFLIYIISFITISFLIYISVYDFEYFEIPDKSTIIFIVLFLLINIILLLLRKDFALELWEQNFFVPSLNIVAGSFYAGLILLLVLITKGKGMGGGDIRIAAIVGLILGSKLIVAFYVTIFSGLFFGIIYGLIKGKFKGLAIPFVPFMIFGALVGFFLAPQISAAFFQMFLNFKSY
jgi:prepilin signal peptidase PulO-like enzyme (type II secretory pathway)